MSLSYALSEFGAALGVGPLDLPSQGAVNLQLFPDCRLSIEEVDEDVLLYILMAVPHIDAATCLALLQACDLRTRLPHEPCVQAGLRGQGADSQIMLLLRYPAQGLQASQLQSGVALLDQCRRDWLGMAH
jgi:hypothetical protein